MTDGMGPPRPTRPELPTDAEALEPMGAAFADALQAGLTELGLADNAAAAPPARHSYEMHARLLREWDRAINLTAVRDPAEVARRHTCDALSAVPTLAELVERGAALLDVGSGGGYPGLPLAASLPLSRVGLLDSVRKKARFLRVAAAAVSAALNDRGAHAPTIDVIAERAEDAADEPGHRASWDVVCARAVGSLAEVLELGLPLTREGGWVVAWKREGADDALRVELRDAGSIIRAAGGGRPEVVPVEASFLQGHRLVTVRKERPTPASYPRAPDVRRRHRG